MAGATRFKTETYTVADSLATNVAALTATSGVSISNAEAVTAILAAEATRTLTSGAMRCYVYGPITSTADGNEGATSVWIPYNALDADSVSSTVANRCFPLGDKNALTAIGRIVWLPDTLVVSAGSTVTLTYWTRRRRA